MADEYLANAFEVLATKINKLNQFKNVASEVFSAQHEEVVRVHEALPEWSLKRTEGSSYFLHYQSPSTGSDLLVPPKSYQIKDEIELNSLQKLKTYQWLLVDAYEVFEDFVEGAYAYCGLKGLSIWVQPDGWVRDDKKDIDAYIKAPFKGKVRTPHRQLKAFRQGSQHFAQYETENLNGRNYRVVLVIIEKLRHAIVHFGGYCEDLQSLQNKVQADLADMDIKAVRKYIDSHFMPHEGNNLVDLFEFPAYDINGNPNGGYHDPMLGYFRTLVEYAQLIKESIQVHPKFD